MLDLSVALANPGPHPELAAARHARETPTSDILAIAAEIGALRARGEQVANFTIGDFDPKIFPIPAELTREIVAALEGGATSYPPAVGVPELRKAILEFYQAKLGLSYPDGSVLVGSGARPPIYAAFQCLLDPGDKVVYPVPTWNMRYYIGLSQAVGCPITTSPEDAFMPRPEAVVAELEDARLLVLNSPLNPCGTMMRPDLLAELCDAVLAVNRRREAAGERPLLMLYDQVYWQLVFGDVPHVTPVHLRPEMARYTLLVDAISKCWAATGLRVGWVVGPPWIIQALTPLLGHVGAWAPRPEQVATARLLLAPSRLDAWMSHFIRQLSTRLELLHAGLSALAAEGLPVEVAAPEGALYLSARFDLRGRTFGGLTVQSDDDQRKVLLAGAGVAVVPFTAFGYPPDTGWVRFSVGSVSEADVAGAVARLGALLRASDR